MFEIFIASDIRKEKLYAEIRYNDVPIGEVNQEEQDRLTVIIYKSVEHSVFLLSDFQKAIDTAKEMLLNPATPGIVRFDAHL